MENLSLARERDAPMFQTPTGFDTEVREIQLIYAGTLRKALPPIVLANRRVLRQAKKLVLRERVGLPLLRASRKLALQRAGALTPTDQLAPAIGFCL
jgi:hypothetical protein